MTLKQKVIKELNGLKCKIRYYKKSPYMKRRYKPEYVEQEVWIYVPGCQYGYLVTESDYNNEKFRKDYFEMIQGEQKNKPKEVGG